MASCPPARQCATTAVARPRSRSMHSIASRVFPTPGAAKTVARCGRRPEIVRSNASMISAISRSRPTSGVSNRRTNGAASASTVSINHASPVRSAATACRTARHVRVAEMIWPGSAASCRRVASSTGAPATSGSPVTTSPLERPIRAVGAADRSATAAVTARSESSSCATGTPNAASRRAPPSCTTRAPCRPSSLGRVAQVLVQDGSPRLGIVGRADGVDVGDEDGDRPPRFRQRRIGRGRRRGGDDRRVRGRAGVGQLE